MTTIISTTSFVETLPPQIITTPSPNSSKSSLLQQIPIVVGVAVGCLVILITVLTVCYCKARKRSKTVVVAPVRPQMHFNNPSCTLLLLQHLDTACMIVRDCVLSQL
eukprot:m.189382 g.189382  ORF g.189382 m.189382 type:complete len:107 (-) comp14792_c0_seq24:84-404(-)